MSNESFALDLSRSNNMILSLFHAYTAPVHNFSPHNTIQKFVFLNAL